MPGPRGSSRAGGEKDAAPLPVPPLRRPTAPLPRRPLRDGPPSPAAPLCLSPRPAERRSLARRFARSPCALPEMSHYNGTSSTPHSLFSSPCTMWIHSRQPQTPPCKGGARGEAEGGKEEEEEAREEAGAALPSVPRLPAALTPVAHPARGRKAVAGPERTARAAWARRGGPGPGPSPPPRTPEPSALGLFHWRTLPKMVICVRGRECGFPRFRVTWRERDSLAGSRARRGLPPPLRRPGKGRGAGPPSAAARASAPGFTK